MRFRLALQKVSYLFQMHNWIALKDTVLAILIRNLHPETTEDTLAKSLSLVLGNLVNKILELEIGKDPVWNKSRGVAYLKLDSIADAEIVKEALSNLNLPLTIDGNTCKCIFRIMIKTDTLFSVEACKSPPWKKYCHVLRCDPLFRHTSRQN